MDKTENRKSIAVITAIFGSYDDVPPVPKGFDEAVLVSDKKIDSDWRNIVIESKQTPRLSAKLPKFRPDKFTKCNSSVWVDASMRDDSDWLLEASLEKLRFYDLVLFRHPQRDNILEEMLESIKMDKYFNQPIVQQVRNYQLLGFKDDVGLWAGGVIARNHNSNNITFGDQWLEQNENWSIQDQISLPYIIWKNKIEVGTFDEDQYTGPLKWIHHKGEYLESRKVQTSQESILLRRLKTAVSLLQSKNYKVFYSILKKSICK
jgi:hypothetical protein